MTTEYKNGFVKVCSEHGMSERQAGSLYKLGKSLELKMPKSGVGSMYTGAIIGGLTGLTREALSDKERKNYLRALILSVATGSAAGLATSYARENKLYDKVSPYVKDIAKRVRSAAKGARKGFLNP